MKNLRQDVLLWVLLCGGIGILWGAWLESSSYAGMMDFRAVYYAARAVAEHRDPYDPADLKAVYLSEGGKLPADPDKLERVNQGLFVCVNLPTSFFLVAPLAALPWGPAHLLWMLAMAGSFLAASYLVLNCAAKYATGPSLLFAGILLIDFGSLILLGNLAAIVVSFCVFAVWSFLSNRYTSIGVVCLGLALALKPHDAGFLWLYFLLLGGAYRKHALRALLLTAAVAIPAVLWVSSVAPTWQQQLQTNLAASSAQGQLNDPGPTSLSFNGPDAPIDLQAAFSVYRNDPLFYNRCSHAVGGLLLLAAAILVLRAPLIAEVHWFALAAFAALSMLPVYHRGHDAKLLLLAIPACALLWREKGMLRWLSFLVTGAAIATTAVLPAAFLEMAAHRLARELGPGLGAGVPLLLAQLAPLSLLALGLLQLWVYWAKSPRSDRMPAAAGPCPASGLCEPPL